MKATHFGHCQLCGHEQKLPGGTLAKHGYSVEWSQFIGVCPGSSHSPIEVANYLLAEARERALASVAFLNAQAEAVLQLANVFWVQEYRVVGTSRSKYGNRPVKGYSWHTYGLDAVSEDGKGYTDVDGKNQRFIQKSLYGTVDEIVAELNKRRADFLRREAEGFASYAAWLEDRIENWKPEPLRPVPSEVALS